MSESKRSNRCDRVRKPSVREVLFASKAKFVAKGNKFAEFIVIYHARTKMPFVVNNH